MKLACLVLLLAVVSFSDAQQYDDETASLMSYLLARMERLESKIKDLSYSKTSRSQLSYSKLTRDLSYSKDVSHSRTSRDANKEKPQCNCPPGTVTYVRWGNSTCPYGAHAIYSGFTAGSWYDHHGAAVEPLCLPPDPQYLKSQAGFQNQARLYGAEYQTSGPLNHADNRNIPCALCQAYARTSVIMIPSRYDCPPGWITEYYGYLMAGHVSHKAGTTYTCMDKSLEQIEGSGSDTNGRLFYTVEAHCKHYIPCSDKELTCVVCTK